MYIISIRKNHQAQEKNMSNITNIIRKELLPEEFIDSDFKHFRIAGDQKITIDVENGRYAAGIKSEQPLYTYNELESLTNIKNGKYLQFVPHGTPYSILDFDTDKSLTDDERKEQIRYILSNGKLLGQFDGRIEYSASGLGLHAYIEDRYTDGIDKKMKVRIDTEKVGSFDVEIFIGYDPIILTGKLVDEPLTDFDTIPPLIAEELEKTAQNPSSTSTEEKNITPLSAMPEPSNDDISRTTEAFKRIDMDRYTNGYKEGEDASKIDFYIANSLIAATKGNVSASYEVLTQWMIKHRPSTGKKLTQKEIANKAKRAIEKAYSNYMAESEKPKNDGEKNIADIRKIIENSPHTDADRFMNFLFAQKHLLNTPKSFNPIEGSSVLFEGATHIIMAPSKEGKTELITNELSKLTGYNAVILDGDMNGADAVARKGENTQWLQPLQPDEYLDMILLYMEKNEADFSRYIFVVDSLKNFRNGVSIDGNDASDIIDRLKRLTQRGATLVILHHVTATDTGVKMKGNAEAIMSSCDVIYSYSRKNGLICERSRISSLTNGQPIMAGTDTSTEKKTTVSSMDELIVKKEMK